SVSLEENQSKTLKITGTTSKVNWSSNNKSIATVSSTGKVTAKSKGTATITASVAGKKIYSKITVKEPIKISSQSVSLEENQSKTLKITGTTSKVNWSSNDKSVATVSSTGKVTAKSKGTATITASVAGKKLTSKVTVKKPITTSTSTTNSNTLDSLTTSSQESSTKVVGYYAAWAKYSGFTPDKIDASKLTHINYAFANIGSDNKITLGYPDIDPQNIASLNNLKTKYPNLKTLIAVGGWSWSGRFSNVALTDTSRSTFAKSIVDFILKYGFDGVDLDWEYPVSGGLSTNVRRPEDKTNFTLLLKEIRNQLDAQGKIDGKQYILTFAGAAGTWYINNVELSNLHQYVDYANVMTYDIHGTWENTTNFNAPLFNMKDSPSNLYNWSVDASIKAWQNSGFPSSKIVMGIPFYGYIYKSVSTDKNGLYQTYSGAASISYNNIAANYLKTPGYTRFFHSDAMVPWLFNGSTFITYEDEQSMALKANYIKTKKLGGAMIWELSQDPNRVLLSSLYNGLK
ncbi:MAG: glycoside hydrolase family 18, partial [Anaerocolumna sp.]|nr:glycoside hydrolase family 18 [Anaerocolumna sp.]